MSRTFDIRRFGRLVWHDVRSCPREYLFSGLWVAAAFAPLMVLTQPLFGGDTFGTFYRLTMMVSMIALQGAMVPMYVYPNAGKKKRGIYFAMLPATKAEKHLSMVFVSMVVTPMVLLAIGLTCDVLFTVVHLPGYHKYFWQAEMWHTIDLQMIVGVVVTFIGAVFANIYANAIQRKGLRYIVYTVAWLWLIGGMIAAPALFYVKSAPVIYSVVIAVEVSMTLLFAWLSRRQLDRMSY